MGWQVTRRVLPVEAVSCPDCGGEQVLRVDPTYHPTRWRCLVCHVDYFEDDEEGTPDNSVLVFRYPGVVDRGSKSRWGA